MARSRVSIIKYLSLISTPAATTDGQTYTVNMLGAKNEQVIWLRSLKGTIGFTDITNSRTYSINGQIQIAPLAPDQPFASNPIDTITAISTGSVSPSRALFLDCLNQYYFEPGEMTIGTGFTLTFQAAINAAFGQTLPGSWTVQFQVLMGFAYSPTQSFLNQNS